YEDVRRFHDSVVRNRQAQLERERTEAEQRLRRREEELKQIDARRAKLLSLLRSTGAIEGLVALQQQLAREESEAESLRRRYEAAVRLECSRVSFNVERAQLV